MENTAPAPAPAPRQNMRMLRDEYYDTDTFHLMMVRLTDDEKKEMGLDMSFESIRSRWRSIVLALDAHFLDEYYSQETQACRNQWFQKYLDLERHDLPRTLLPL